MSTRAAGSVLHHLGPRVFGAAAPSVTAPRALLALAGRGQGDTPVFLRLLSISASEAKEAEAKADVAEIYASKEDYASSAYAGAKYPISASEAKADVAEVYASKMNYASIVGVKAAVAEEAAKATKAQVDAAKEKRAEEDVAEAGKDGE